jgi:hypothetical protein
MLAIISFAGGAVLASSPFEPLGPSSRRGAMVISEIMVDTPSGWGGTNSLEFVEIYNSGLITEDLTGHRFSGEIDYVFPDGTTLAPGAFIVVAKDPAAAQSIYGVACLGPYSGKLSNTGGRLRFRNELDGILLEVEYDDKDPWPVAAFGAGHSMVLSRPSYGEGDPRAWSASDLFGGSPGTTESYYDEPARSVVINEYLAHTDLPQVDYLELFNTDTVPVDVSGAWLTDEAGTNKYRIADGTTIPARGFLSFDETELGFALSAAGEQVYFINSTQTRVIDAVAFRGQENGIPEGRYPDGAPGFQRLSTVTAGSANGAPLLSTVVINEIMYHPISDSKNDEYIELYNRSADEVDLSGWRLQDGIFYEFPSNTVIAGNGYLVVAENRTNLMTKYTQLNPTNTYGNYDGSLANGGERVALSMPDDLVSTNEFGVVTTNVFYIPVDEVTYVDGGRWGQWSDGGGSSLELIDPDADNRQPASWADSDETAKAPWTTIDVTEVLENGLSTWYGRADRFEFYLQGAGEMLVDDLEFENNGGGNLLSNGDFTSGANGWTFGGVVRNSYVESGAGQDGSAALHLVSVARGDTGCNQANHALDSQAWVGGSNTGTIRAKVRWLKGSPYILLRLRGHWMEASLPVNVPTDCGTPGQANSRLVANAGPPIYDVVHSPILPEPSESVVVTARTYDPDGISSMSLHYRIDPSISLSTVVMHDDGTGGDAVAGDGLYSATLPGQSVGALAAFHITASDGSASNQFPAAVPTQECLVRWGETEFAGTLGTYRLWLTDANISFWTGREINANDPIDATFVYGSHRVVYNAGTLHSGSPFHALYGADVHGPLGDGLCDYEINFNPDERFLGSEPFVLLAESGETTTQSDIMSTWIGRKLGQQYNHVRYINMMINGVHHGEVYLDTQQPNSEMLDEYFPNDSEGEFRKIEDWFEFDLLKRDFDYVTATMERFNDSNGDLDVKRYRWNWRPRVTENHDQWFAFTNLIVQVNDTVTPDYEGRIRNWVDIRNFLRPIAVNHIVGNWDSYGYTRGKNMYLYKPDDQGWRLMLWDMEFSLGNQPWGGGEWNAPIFDFHDPVLESMIMNTTAFYREYLVAIQEAVDKVIDPDVVNPILDERYANLIANGISVISPDGMKAWISERRTYLQSVLPSSSFEVYNPPVSTTSYSYGTVYGSAPLQVADVLVNGILYPITWVDTLRWVIQVPLVAGENSLTITGVDRGGHAVPGANAAVTIIRNDTGTDPLDAVVINEWMADNDTTIADPADGDYEDWFELYNTGADAVDLGGCYLTDELTEPFKFQIPDNGHYTLPPGGYLLVWADGESAQNTTNQPDLHVGFSLSRDGEAIGLYAPDGREIDTVTFGAQTADLSEGRFPDGDEGILVLSSPTPLEGNWLPAALTDLEGLSVSDTNITFNWSSVTGMQYQIYYKYDLQDACWIPLSMPITGTGHILWVTNSMDAPQCFYRVGFSHPSMAPFMEDVSMNGTDISFSWNSVGGLRYQIYYKDDLRTGSWVPIGSAVEGTGGSISFTNTAPGASRGFYCIGLQP